MYAALFAREFQGIAIPPGPAVHVVESAMPFERVIVWLVVGKSAETDIAGRKADIAVAHVLARLFWLENTAADKTCGKDADSESHHAPPVSRVHTHLLFVRVVIADKMNSSPSYPHFMLKARKTAIPGGPCNYLLKYFMY